MPLHTSMPRSLITLLLVAVVLATALPAVAAEPQGDANGGNDQPQQVAEQLAQAMAAIETKKQQIEALNQYLKTAPEGVRAEVEAQLAEAEKSLGASRNHFVALAVGGINLGTSQEEQPLDWQSEVLEIAKPLMASLKALTEKPRAMDRLRTQVQLREKNLEFIDKALANLQSVSEADVQPAVAARVDALFSEWLGRRQTALQDLDMLQYQLAQHESETTSILGNLDESVGRFLRGRGLTLVLAVGAAVLTWWLMRLLARVVFRTRELEATRPQAPSYRIALLGFRLVSGLLVLVVVLFVLYVAGDWFLLGLAIIALMGAAISLRNTLPRYVDQARLFLNLGPVREGERVIYGGLPWRVRALNIYSTLFNPDLHGGVVRLPASAMAQLMSRPDHKSEPWFPTRIDDIVLLDGEVLAKVLLQTPDVVRLQIAGAVRDVPTATFVRMGMRNLSQQGYATVVTFGIDYAHQAICLDQVAPRFQDAVEARLRGEYGDDLVSVFAAFKEAAANSLDYLVVAVMGPGAAADYFSVTRAIQQACVAVCNAAGWGIPFSQLVIHPAEGLKLSG